MRDAEHRSAGATAAANSRRLGERRETFPLLLFLFKIKLPVFPVSQNLGASDDAGSTKTLLSRFLFSSEEVSHIASPARSVWFPVTPRRVGVKKAPSFPGAPYGGIIICLNIRGAPAALHFVFPLSGLVKASRAATRVVSAEVDSRRGISADIYSAFRSFATARLRDYLCQTFRTVTGKIKGLCLVPEQRQAALLSHLPEIPRSFRHFSVFPHRAVGVFFFFFF